MPPRQLRPATNTTAPTSCGAHGVRKPDASRRRRQACGEEVRGRRVGYNPSIRSLMTTRGWPTPRSCNETGTDSSGLPGTSCRLLPGQGHHHDRTSAHQPSPWRAPDLRRVRDGLGTAQERTRPRGAAGKVGPSQPHPHRGMGPSPSLRQHPTEPPRHTLGSRHSTGLEHDNAERRGSALGGCRRTSRLSPTGWPGTPGSRKTTASHGPPPVDPGPLRRDVPIYMLLSVASTGRT